MPDKKKKKKKEEEVDTSFSPEKAAPKGDWEASLYPPYVTPPFVEPKPEPWREEWSWEPDMPPPSQWPQGYGPYVPSAPPWHAPWNYYPPEFRIPDDERGSGVKPDKTPAEIRLEEILRGIDEERFKNMTKEDWERMLRESESNPMLRM